MLSGISIETYEQEQAPRSAELDGSSLSGLAADRQADWNASKVNLIDRSEQIILAQLN